MKRTIQFRNWIIRLYYFLFLGAFSFITPYLALFYRRQGMSGVQIGILGTITAIIGVIFAPTWGRWSDRIVHPRRLLQVAFLGSAICYLLLSLQDMYLWIAIFVGISTLFLSGIDPISDTMAIRSSDGENRVSFGSIRLWGSLGWALFVYLSGMMIEKYGIKVIFWGYGGFALLIIFVLDFTRQSKGIQKGKIGTKPLSYRNLVFSMIKDPTILGLALTLLVLWFVRVGIYQFEAIFMSELGAGESLIGLVKTIAALVELPSMLWADYLVNRLGAERVLKLAFSFFGLQAGVIVLFPRITMFFVAAVFSGIAFSFFNVALIVFVDERAPFAQTATVLALLTSTLRGVILILASLFSGFAFDRFGAYWLYVIGLTGCFIGLVIFNVFVTRGQRQMIADDE